MARYIDADKLKERLLVISVVSDDLYGMGINRGLDRAETAIDMMPTADVAPREEVAREIFEEIEREITDALKSNYKVLPQLEESEAMWNNVNGKINALRGIEYFIEELKKKHTGERHETTR